MKIVHINHSDRWGGGAAIACCRHHEALLRAGFDSKVVVIKKDGVDSTVVRVKRSRVEQFLWKACNKLFVTMFRHYAAWNWNCFGNDLSALKEVAEADVVFIHALAFFTMSIKSIERLLESGKPVYWFMHDMGAITGGCCHSLDCERFMAHCYRCPMTHNRRGSLLNHDLSYWQFEAKRKHLSKYGNLRFVTPSRWLADKVGQSALFSSHDVFVVRNILDTDVFAPRDKILARGRLGLPLDGKLILFGADSITSPYKGWSLLRDALAEPIAGAEAVVYGREADSLVGELGVTTHSVGHINNTDRLVDLYSACDLLVMPSIADTYPNVVIEAQSCGLPVVGTRVGGIPEMIPAECLMELDAADIRATIIRVLRCGIGQSPREDVIANNHYSRGLVELLNEVDFR